MKKYILPLLVFGFYFLPSFAQQELTEEMQRQWRQLKHSRTVGIDYKNSNIPLGETVAETKSTNALPEDRVWFPGEWEEVQAVVVTPYYSYLPDTNLGSGRYIADPAVTGYALYYKYSSTQGWVSTNTYGPYRSVMDTTSTFGKVFFYLMDGIQQGHAEAWVRVEKAEDSAKVLRTLARLNLRHDSVRFIVGPGNSFWYRDCGPICFYYGDQDSVAMLDFEYYPGRALDDSLPSLIMQQLGVPNYINTIEWEGGNCLVDGVGFLFTSDAVYRNNTDSYGQLVWNGRNISSLHYQNKRSISEAQTREALRSLLGQRETHVLPTYQYDGGTGHIDLYADMVEENGFVFSIMPDHYSTWTDYATGMRNIDSLCAYTTFFDRAYYKDSIPFPSTDNGGYFASERSYDQSYTRTYSNHTFVNDLILQPCFSQVVNGEPSAAWDRANVEKLKKAYPGYTIYPIDVREFDGSGGAIHCITKQIPAESPIRILHKSIVGCANDIQDSMPVSAIITNRSGIAHAECVYRIGEGEWQTVNLTANGNRHYGHMPRPQSTFYEDVVVYDTLITAYDSVAVIDTNYSSDSTIVVYDTSYTYLYDTTYTQDTVPMLVDTVVRVEYYLSATNNEGKTITKPMTAHQGGYYTYYYTGQLDTVAWIDSTQYDFDTTPVAATDITFLIDGNRIYSDTSTRPDPLAIQAPVTEEAYGQFYPNPAIDEAHISIDLANGGTLGYAIIDNVGRTVHTGSLQSAGHILFTIRTDRLTPGIYTVRFSQGTTQTTRRLVVR